MSRAERREERRVVADEAEGAVADDGVEIEGETPASSVSRATIFWHRAEISRSVLSNVFSAPSALASEARELVS